MIKKIGLVSFIVLFILLLCLPDGMAQQYGKRQRIVLLVSDNYSKPVADAVRLLKQDVGFSSNYEVIVGEDASAQMQSADAVVCYVHTPQLINRYVKQMKQVVGRGGVVYAVGSSPEADNYKKWGMKFDPTVDTYFENASVENINMLVKWIANRHLGGSFSVQEPKIYPNQGVVDWHTGNIYEDLASFKKEYKTVGDQAPWVGLYAFRYEFVSGQDAYLKEYAQAFDQAGYNVLLFYGFPLEPTLKEYCMDAKGQSRIDALVNFSSLPGGDPKKLAATFSRLGIPVITGVNTAQDRNTWDVSKVGLPIFERTFAFIRPELMGQIQPTMATTQESYTDSLGNSYKQKTILPGRKENIVEKVKAWMALRHLPNAKKDVTLIYYNGHPGKHNIGASYLNVLPKSIQSIIEALKQHSYDVGTDTITADGIFDKVMQGGRNIGTWAPGELTRLVKENHPILVPIESYKEWFAKLHPKFQQQVIQRWGPPDSARIMVWTDAQKRRFFVLPQITYGKVHLMPQPARAWEDDEEATFHDVNLPPHHQYIAFYLYLQHQQKTNALIHLGTHGTLEWLSGREAGLDDSDAPDALLGSMVNIYPYIMDNVGEGTQAKRRGQAIIIDYMTPPFQEAGLKPELRELAGAINDYSAALDKSAVLADSHLKVINRLAKQNNLLRDLAIEHDVRHEDVQRLEHYLQELNEQQVPMGMHTFGVSPDSGQAYLTAVAMANRLKGLSADERQSHITEFYNRIVASGPAEMQALLDALSGKYISPATGNDPIRNPDALPTGKNFHAFDPARMPSAGIYESGEKLADQLISQYRVKHNGNYPDKVAFNLWAVETIRHEGIMESQILSLMGVRPQYDGFGKVKGLELIPRDSLGHPRVDVVVTPSGLYRDMFPQMITFLDQAVSLAYGASEKDNSIRIHADSTKRQLAEMGVKDSAMRERLALVRLFGAQSGSYGIGVDNAVQASDKWDNSQSIADVYFNRSAHLYGQGFWGDSKEDLQKMTGKDLAVSLFKGALSGTKAVVHSRSSNLTGVLDNDDFFQYLGGMTLAVKAVDGEEPEIMVSNLANPESMKQESLDQFIGRELNSRYLNPEWINKMLDEGYAGARMVGQVTDNMWGWQATTEKAIRAEDWQQWHDVYVADKYDLGIKQKFAKADNLYAYEQMLARMLEVVRKEYWKPDEKTKESLVESYLETVEATGLSCSDQVCGNEKLVKYVEEVAQKIGKQQQLNKLHQALGTIHAQGSVGTMVSQAISAKHAGKPISKQNKPVGQQKQMGKKAPASKIKGGKQSAVSAKPTLKGYKMEEHKLSLSANASTRHEVIANWKILLSILLVFICGFVFHRKLTR